MVDVLLDTHVIYWILINDSRLTDEAIDFIFNRNSNLYYSIASIWEMTIKINKHPKNYIHSAKDFIDYCKKMNLSELSISDKHILKLKDLKFKNETICHHDPFDKMLIAQSIVENMCFVTHDKILQNYDISNIKII